LKRKEDAAVRAPFECHEPPRLDLPEVRLVSLFDAREHNEVAASETLVGVAPSNGNDVDLGLRLALAGFGQAAVRGLVARIELIIGKRVQGDAEAKNQNRDYTQSVLGVHDHPDLVFKAPAVSRFML
jgi:hypothetical protein